MRDVEDCDLFDKHKGAFHLAGIIPFCGEQYRDRKFPWHPALLPLGEGYTLAQHAVVQCAFAGCDSIWIVFDDSMIPFFKNTLGDWIEDPVYCGVREQDPINLPNNKMIPIYYVPQSYYSEHRRDSVSYNVFRGAEIARQVTGQISALVTPDRYFVTFPYTVIDHFEVKEHRKKYTRSTIFEDSNGNSIENGVYAPFVASFKELKKCKKHVWHHGTGRWDPTKPDNSKTGGDVYTQSLPPEERYNARWFGPDEVYKPFIESEPQRIVLPWIDDAGTFEGYRNVMKRDYDFVKYNVKAYFQSTHFNSSSYDDVEIYEEEE